MKKQKGQMILALILVMTVALAIGLSIVQKSLVDVSTASKVEESSRAFSAAEAGIEKALKGDTAIQSFADTNSSIKQISDTGLVPCVPGQPLCSQGAGTQQSALEYPPLAKEDTAQVWLADLNSTSSPPASFYTQNTLTVYWGNSTASDKAGLEVTLVYYDSAALPPAYKVRKWYLDNSSAIRGSSNGFEQVICGGSDTLAGYQCKKTLGVSPDAPLPSGLVLLRARLLYNATSQLFAVQPPTTATCGIACSLPPQARTIYSIGVSGETQRTVKVFQLYKVVPPFFDYAIFSAGEINK